ARWQARRRRGWSDRPGDSGCRRAQGGADRPWKAGSWPKLSTSARAAPGGGSRMLRGVGEARRIERAIRHLQSALKGVAARGVRLTWRGGELPTTIHWARDDAYSWPFQPRRPRAAL